MDSILSLVLVSACKASIGIGLVFAVAIIGNDLAGRHGLVGAGWRGLLDALLLVVICQLLWPWIIGAWIEELISKRRAARSAAWAEAARKRLGPEWSAAGDASAPAGVHHTGCGTRKGGSAH